MLYKTKEIVVCLSEKDIKEKLLQLKRKSPFFQKIESNRFKIRINSNRPSLFRTSVSGIISGELLCADNKDETRIVYHTEPPIIFWVFLLPFFAFIFDFIKQIFSIEIQPDMKLVVLSVILIFLFGILTFAEAVSQTNISEERFLKAFENETMGQGTV